MNQILATLQQQEDFAKLSPTEQQAFALQIILKHQQPVGPPVTAGGAPMNLRALTSTASQQVQQPPAGVVSKAQQQHQKMSPR